MDYNKINSNSNVKAKYYNIFNGNDLYLYKNNLILSEYQKELNILDQEIQRDEKNINNKLKNLKNIENQNNYNELKTYNNNYYTSLFETFNNINNKKNNKSHRDIIQECIMKSEPNIFTTKSKSNNNYKKIISKTNTNNSFYDFSNISEIKKTDLSFEEQNININPDFDYITPENNKKCFTLNNFYNNLKRAKDEKGIPYMKEMEIKKMMSDCPELVYNEIYKSFNKVNNLKKENYILKRKIKKLNMEIKEKNDLIDEFTELFKQSKVKFEKLILKNKINIKEIENKNTNEIEHLSSIIKKLENENSILYRRNTTLLNSLNKYQTYTKSMEEKYSNEENTKNNNIKKNINLYNESTYNKNNDKPNIITTRETSNIVLNSRFNKYHNNYSKQIFSLLDNNMKLIDNYKQKKFSHYSLIRSKNNNSDKLCLRKKNNNNNNTISRIGVESDLRKEKAIFRDMSANIGKKKYRDIGREREKSVRILNTINGKVYNSDLINL